MADKRPSSHPRLLSSAALAGIVYSGLSVLLLHFLPTGYNPVTQAVSDYGVGQYAVWMDLAFFAIGIGIVALALTLLRFDSSPTFGRIGPVLLGIGGASMFLLGLFPTDLEGAPSTTHGSLHNLLGLVGFLSLIAGTLVLSRRFGRIQSLSKFYKSSVILAIVTAVLFVLLFGFFASVGYFGAGERAFLLALASWLLLTSIRFYRLAGKSPSAAD